MLGDFNKLFVLKCLLTRPSKVLPVHLKQTFRPMIWIFTESKGDGNESRLLFEIFSTLFLCWTLKILEMFSVRSNKAIKPGFDELFWAKKITNSTARVGFFNNYLKVSKARSLKQKWKFSMKMMCIFFFTISIHPCLHKL